MGEDRGDELTEIWQNMRGWKDLKIGGGDKQENGEYNVFASTLGENCLVGYNIVTRIGSFPVQIPPGTVASLGTQTCYKAPSDLRVKTKIMQRLKSSE